MEHTQWKAHKVVVIGAAQVGATFAYTLEASANILKQALIQPTARKGRSAYGAK